MSSNLADLLADLPPVLTSSGQDEAKTKLSRNWPQVHTLQSDARFLLVASKYMVHFS